MSEKSIKHLEVLANELNILVRQVYRLYQKLLEEGPSGFLSKKKGKASNHQLSKILKSRVLELVACEKYEGFGPSFMNEKLLELHSITISTDTLPPVIRTFSRVFFWRSCIALNFLSAGQ